jgi:hypothetical protein
MTKPLCRAATRANNALKLTKRGLVGALRAPSSVTRASQLSAVLDGHSALEGIAVLEIHQK